MEVPMPYPDEPIIPYKPLIPALTPWRFTVFMLVLGTLMGAYVLATAPDEPISKEDLIAWQCSGVTDENWRDPVWDEGETYMSSRIVCERILESRPDSTPCTFGNLPFYCQTREDGEMIVHQYRTTNAIYLTPAHRAQVADALVIIEPSAPDPRGE